MQNSVGASSRKTRSVKARLPRGSISQKEVASSPLSLQTVTVVRPSGSANFLALRSLWTCSITSFHMAMARLGPDILALYS